MQLQDFHFDQSVLCWLATVSAAGQPNVSPKEIFCTYREDYLLIANIASPGSLRNIQDNPAVCVSFIDILVQKGAQIKGTATIVYQNDPAYDALAQGLHQLTGGMFPFASLFKIRIESIKPIVAPRYRLFPETTEAEQIASAKKTYGV
ncbi:MAG: pyridoxamine 5'-phosphate oxidase family protein [Bacteroidota bacterium]